ncbi:hypothetical protein HN51_022669 [Arachis hypogaea]
MSFPVLLSYEQDGDIALTYGVVARECIRHQCVARHVLGSDHMKKFFDYIQLSNFEIASDALSTFKELSTRHKSTVSEFLSKNYDWFFEEYNTRLLESNSYFTRRLAIKLLADMLLDRSNSSTMVRHLWMHGSATYVVLNLEGDLRQLLKCSLDLMTSNLVVE